MVKVQGDTVEVFITPVQTLSNIFLAGWKIFCDPTNIVFFDNVGGLIIVYLCTKKTYCQYNQSYLHTGKVLNKDSPMLTGTGKTCNIEGKILIQRRPMDSQRASIS